MNTSRTVLITGTSSGFGKVATELLARRGWNVIATMRSPQGGEFADLPNVLVHQLDVTNPETIAPAIAAGIDRFGAIDAVINNAGGLVLGAFESVPDAAARELFEVNAFGVFNVIRAILPHFRSRRSGTILNISSAVALVPMPLLSLYTATKCAIEGFSESLAFELAPFGIRVKVLEPGAALTGITSRVFDEFQKLPKIADYEPVINHITGIQAANASNGMASAEDIAIGIVAALEDESPRLRYVQAEEFTELLASKKEQDEEQFLAGQRALWAMD